MLGPVEQHKQQHVVFVYEEHTVRDWRIPAVLIVTCDVYVLLCVLLSVLQEAVPGGPCRL